MSDEKERLARMLRDFPTWGHAALHYEERAERAEAQNERLRRRWDVGLTYYPRMKKSETRIAELERQVTHWYDQWRDLHFAGSGGVGDPPQSDALTSGTDPATDPPEETLEGSSS